MPLRRKTRYKSYFSSFLSFLPLIASESSVLYLQTLQSHRVTQMFTITKAKLCVYSHSSLYNVKANCQWLLLLAQILILQTVRSTFLDIESFPSSIGSKPFSFGFIKRTMKARELMQFVTFFSLFFHISSDIPIVTWVCLCVSMPGCPSMCVGLSCRVAASSSAVCQK